MGLSRYAATGLTHHLIYGDVDAVAAQVLDHAQGAAVALRRQVSRHGNQFVHGMVDSQAQQVQGARAVIDAELDARHHTNVPAPGSLQGRGNAVNGVMVGHSHEDNPALAGMINEPGGGKPSVRSGGMGVQVYELHGSHSARKKMRQSRGASSHRCVQVFSGPTIMQAHFTRQRV
jgi:hypothetical protein